MKFNDVSKFQETINWAEHAKVRDMVIIRAHNGWIIDPTFAVNRNGAHSNGMKAIGLYQYVTSGKDVATQARQFVGAVGHLQPNEFVVADLEDPAVQGGADTAMKAWVWVVEKAFGGRAVIYMNDDNTAPALPPSVTGGRLRWNSKYSSDLPRHPYDIWQHSETSRAPGVPDQVDENTTNLTVAQILSHTRGTVTPVPTNKRPAELAHFNNYNPSAFGWMPNPPNIIPFEWGGVTFPQGISQVAAPAFKVLLDTLAAHGAIPKLYNPGCWGYENRNVTQGSTLSFHAYGLALDLNAPDNGFSASGAAAPHSIKDSAGDIARSLGFEWGGSWTSPKDYMHFELHLAPSDVGVVSTAPVPKPPPEDFLSSPDAQAQLAELTKKVNFLVEALSIDTKHVGADQAHVAVPPYSVVNKIDALNKKLDVITNALSIAEGTVPKPAYSIFNVANQAKVAAQKIQSQVDEIHATVVKGVAK